MTEEDKYKKCPEYCPFLKINNTYCELFKKSLQTANSKALKCESCKNPQQRMTTYKSLGLTLDSRISMWQKAVMKHNEIEISKKREEESIRQSFSSFLSTKYGSKPPLEGNMYLNNLIINLYMVLDATERHMMMSVLNGNGGLALIKAIEKAPRDDSLLRNVRRELDSAYRANQHNQQEISQVRTQTR